MLDFTSSAFTIPRQTRLIPEDEYINGTNSLPSTKSSAVVCYTNQSDSTELIPEVFRYREKSSSSVSLPAMSDGLYCDLWAGTICLKRTAKPNLSNERHRENSLKLSILEARNLTNKRRYYCDISLDRTLYARTTSKTANDGIFWAEDFELNNLPNVSVLTISLYKETDPSGRDGRRFGTMRFSSKKHRKSSNQLIGFLTIPLCELSTRTEVQTWISLKAPGVAVFPSTNFPEQPDHVVSVLQSTGTSSEDKTSHSQLRIRARYRSLEVLPVKQYRFLKKFVLDKSLPLTSWLDRELTVKLKEDIMGSFVGLHEINGSLVEFLTNLVVQDVANLENDAMAFRSNTVATKAVEYFLKLAGSTYLYNLLHHPVQRVLACLNAWEVNPERLPPSALAPGSLSSVDTSAYAASNQLPELNSRPSSGSLKFNQLMLLQHLSTIWQAIQTSLSRFPNALRTIFTSFRAALEPTRGREFCDNLISACIFLRLICPALLSPSLFGLVTSFPTEASCQRNLTLLAKSLQTLANFNAFDDKEPFMRFLNGYMNYNIPVMRTFIRAISTPTSNSLGDLDTAVRGLSDVIDEGYELANIHDLLSNLNTPLNHSGDQTPTSSLPSTLADLPVILQDLTAELHQEPRLTTALSLINFSDYRSSPYLDNHHRLHSTLPAKRGESAHDWETVTNSEQSLSHSTSQLEKHPPPCAFYTLHKNPGFHKHDSEHRSESVNILSVDPPDGVVNGSNLNDYDEPYLSPPGEDGSTEHTVGQNHSAVTATEAVSDHIPSASQSTTRPSRSNHAGFDPIYDMVPSSESSSTDDLVDANEKFIAEFKTSLPARMHNQFSDLSKSAPSVQQSTSVSSQVPGTSEVDAFSKMDPLSPRLMPRQVSTACVLLSKGNADQVRETLNTATKLSTFPSATLPLSPPLAEQVLPVPLNVTNNNWASAHLSVSSGKSSAVHPTSESELLHELARVRQQLQESQANAARAADRLSRQEMELTSLRSLLSRARDNTVHASRLKDLHAPVRSNDQRTRVELPNSRLKYHGPPAGLQATTFNDLDAALERLEEEQAALQREHSRIRARLTISRATPRSPCATFSPGPLIKRTPDFLCSPQFRHNFSGKSSAVHPMATVGNKQYTSLSPRIPNGARPNVIYKAQPR